MKMTENELKRIARLGYIADAARLGRLETRRTERTTLEQVILRSDVVHNRLVKTMKSGRFRSGPAHGASLQHLILFHYQTTRLNTVSSVRDASSRSFESLQEVLLARYATEAPYLVEGEMSESRRERGLTDSSISELLLALLPTATSAHFGAIDAPERTGRTSENDVFDALTALMESRASSDALSELQALTRYGGHALVTENWHSAISSLKDADVLAERLGAVTLRLEILDGLGRALQAIGDSATAVRTFSAAKELARDLDDMHAYALLAGNEGVSRLAVGDVSTAVLLFDESLELLRSQPDARSPELATTLAHLGHATARLQKYRRAHVLFIESLEYAQQTSDWTLEARVLRYLGWVSRAEHRWLDSITYFERSLALMRAHGDADDVFRETLRALADSHASLGHQAEAEIIRSEAQRRLPR